MAGGVELANAWIRLTFSAEGAHKQITDELAEATGAADKEGGSAASKWGSSFKKGLVGLGIAAAATGMVAGLYNVGATFDNLTDTIRVGTGATGEALDGLVADAKEVGKQVPASFDDVGRTVADLNTRLGLSGDTLQTVAAQYLEAGRILGEDVDINSTTAAFNAFRIEGDDVSAAMDHLFRVSQATGIGFNQLSGTVKAAAPLVQNLGLDFNETASLVGTLDKAGLDANSTLAKLAPALVRMAKDGEQPAEVFPRVVGELQSFIDAGDDAAALNLAESVFGSRGASQFVAALQSGVVNLDDLNNVAGMTGDTILGVADETASFSERWSQTMNMAQVAIEPLATAIFEGLGGALEGIMPWLQDFGNWLGENPVVLQIAATAVGVLAAAFVGITIATWAMNTALLASPITWIIVGVVALIAAIVLLATNWDAVVAWVSDVWSGFVGWVGDTLQGLANWWNETWDGIVNFFRDTLQNIMNFWLGFPLIGDIIRAVQFLANNWDLVWSTIGKTFEDIWNGIGNFFKGVANWILGGIESFVNGAIDLINGILEPIRVVSGALGDVFGQSWSVPRLSHVRIPRLAEGGIVMPQHGGVLSLIAEAGKPEAVIPLDELENIIAGSDRGPVALDDSSMRTLARYVADLLAPRLREQARKAV